MSELDVERSRTAAPREPHTGRAKRHGRYVATVVALVIADWITKALVQRYMQPYQQIDLIGEYLRLTYIFNPGAAFGIHLGAASRGVFLTLSLVALVALLGMYHVTPARARGRLIAIALIIGGALGNLVDRVRHAHGVVDFLDMGVGTVRWPVFNVADVAVTVGAVILAASLWREDARAPGG